MLVKKYLFFIFLFFFGWLQRDLYAQCTSPINSFPYNEDFESSDGNWVKSTAVHWEWGSIVSKPVISTSGSGSKCWIVGGFSGATYNSGSSFLQSPCFDISSLSNPQITFKIFWETERKYDGASFEYSLDAGANWQTLGSVNSNADCLGENWFNYAPVNFLGGPGWSGNIQSTSGSCQGGGGSGTWLTAKHTLSSITGSTSVSFRFVFAAGTTCNDFDGFAIDDVHVGETPASGADFTYTCSANSTVNFTSTAATCRTSVLWDFGDPASGAANASAANDPAHVFSSPGNYTVTLITNFASAPSIVTRKNITVIAAAVTLTPIKCNADRTGAISVNIDPAGIYSYTWNTSPPQSTASISSLGAGTYTVSITGTNTCNIILPVTLTEPGLLVLNPAISGAKCGFDNGSIQVAVSGGTAPYYYSWSNSATTASVTALPPGVYSLLVTDSNGCTANANNLVIEDLQYNINLSLGKDTTICPGQKLVLNPGNFSSYKWQDNAVASTYTVYQTGTYGVTVTDSFGCTGYAGIKVTVDCPEIYFPSAFTPNGDPDNQEFGPVGNLTSIRNFKMIIYGRWGEVIFESADPYKKWDGKYKGKAVETQVMVWTARYTAGNRPPVSRKGTITVIR